MPVVTEDCKGYTLMDGYRVSPVMFTESQANDDRSITKFELDKRSSSICVLLPPRGFMVYTGF